MSVQELVDTVQFVVNQEGKPQAAVLDMQTWEALINLFEEFEDKQIVHNRLAGWRTKQGWSQWNEFETELVGDVVSTVD